MFSFGAPSANIQNLCDLDPIKTLAPKVLTTGPLDIVTAERIEPNKLKN